MDWLFGSKRNKIQVKDNSRMMLDLCIKRARSIANHKYISPTWKNGNIDIKKSLEDNIINEEGAIETYQELVKLTDGVDPASNSKLKKILADEEEHLQELKDFLGDIK